MDNESERKYEPLSTGENDSFAFWTLKKRFPRLIDLIISTNEYISKESMDELRKLQSELSEGKELREALDSFGSDIDPPSESSQKKFLIERHKMYRIHKKNGWLNIPWFFAETYFFHILLQILGYFDPSNSGFQIDPFLPQKEQEFKNKETWKNMNLMLQNIRKSKKNADFNSIIKYRNIHLLFQLCLWGNRSDLSLPEIAVGNRQNLELDTESSNIIANDSSALVDKWKAWGEIEVGYIADNSGTELLYDLVLIKYLITSKLAKRVTLHLKGYPTYVSDATVEDIFIHLKAIESKAEEFKSSELKLLSSYLKMFINDGRLVLRGDSFWNSHFMFTDISEDLVPELHKSLSGAKLVISKGDANYRRFIYDHCWEPTSTNLRDAIASVYQDSKGEDAELTYPFLFNLICLRTLKSDPLVGVASEVFKKLNETEPGWRTNGSKGVIQFSEYI